MIQYNDSQNNNIVILEKAWKWHGSKSIEVYNNGEEFMISVSFFLFLFFFIILFLTYIVGRLFTLLYIKPAWQSHTWCTWLEREQKPGRVYVVRFIHLKLTCMEQQRHFMCRLYLIGERVGHDDWNWKESWLLSSNHQVLYSSQCILKLYIYIYALNGASASSTTLLDIYPVMNCYWTWIIDRHGYYITHRIILLKTLFLYLHIHVNIYRRKKINNKWKLKNEERKKKGKRKEKKISR